MEAKPKFDEKVLLNQVAEGSQQAFAIIFNYYYPLLFSYIRRILRSEEETENILQDVFTKIWMGREALIYVERFKPYLWVIAKHQAMNAIRRIANQETIHRNFDASLFVNETLEELVDREVQLSLIDEAISDMPEHFRKVWLMNRKDKIKQADIAVQMNISVPTVKKYMQHAVAHIMQYVKNRSSLATAIFVLFYLFSKKS